MNNPSKVFSTAEIRQLDQLSMAEQGITEWQLMERASEAFTTRFLQLGLSGPVHIFCAQGNNGGDGLAIARMLSLQGQKVSVYILEVPGQHPTACFRENLSLIPTTVKLFRAPAFDAPTDGLIIDAILGSGLNRQPDGGLKKTIQAINKSSLPVVAVDIPSGIDGDGNLSPDTAIAATTTITFQAPKPAFFFPEFAHHFGEIMMVSIGLSEKAMELLSGYACLINAEDVKKRIPVRNRWGHKGSYGHVLLVAGSQGKMGAASLAAKAALRAGAGKCTAYVPKSGMSIIQTLVPEAMAIASNGKKEIDGLFDDSIADVLAIGPGIGQGKGAEKAIRKALHDQQKALVIDADGLNLLAKSSEPLVANRQMIITPHPGEADRLWGKSSSGRERLVKAREYASEKGVVVVLKGGKTAICNPDGTLHFCDIGNPGMATAGSGDVLTGVISGLLAQGLSAQDAAIAGVYLHALSGDLAAEALGQHALIASDLIQFLPQAFLKVGC